MSKAMNEEINEERYQFVLSLYLIRTQYTQMGLFQPGFIWVTFRSMMPSKYNRNDDDIKKAVNEWCDGPVAAEVKYGHISKWNTSLVTNMKELFKEKSDFNDDISKWNVSSVTNMSSMFHTTPFDGDISGWNVSSVTDMRCMFDNSPFNGDISGWNVSSVTNMRQDVQ
jgi:surface protein